VGFYSEYLDQNLNFQQLTAERKNQLSRISEIRERDVLVFAADLNKGHAPVSISYPDLLPIQDQLANLHRYSHRLDLGNTRGLRRSCRGYSPAAQGQIRIRSGHRPRMG